MKIDALFVLVNIIIIKYNYNVNTNYVITVLHN